MPEYVIYAHANMPHAVIVEYQDHYFLVLTIPGGWKQRQPYQGYRESLRALDPQEARQIAGRVGFGHYRENAGRTPFGDKAMSKKTVTLSEEDFAYLTKLGDGNLSAGIREAVKQLREKHG